jgi:large conductance mechanosensitive channel
MRGEFMKFLKEYSVIGLAIGVIIGSKAGELVKAITDGLLMPFVTPILSAAGGDWQSAKWDIGPFSFAFGSVIAALLNFLIVAFLVFLFAKKVLKEETVAKK